MKEITETEARELLKNNKAWDATYIEFCALLKSTSESLGFETVQNRTFQLSKINKRESRIRVLYDYKDPSNFSMNASNIHQDFYFEH